MAAAVSVLCALAAALTACARRRYRRAAAILGAAAASVAVYLCVVSAVSFFSPQRILALKEKLCSDDWCVSVDSVSRSGGDVQVTFVISSRARRAPQRERNVSVYLVDGVGHRYNPLFGASPARFDSVLQPGEERSVVASFAAPDASGGLDLVVTRASRFPGLFIIGDDLSLFHKPVVYRIR